MYKISSEVISKLKNAKSKNLLDQNLKEKMKTFKLNLLSGIIVGIIALPLSMALAIAIGVPPQNGLYTAIIAGIIAAYFGSSKINISGPTAAFVVILIPIVQDFGLKGLLVCGLLSGFFFY